VVMEAGQIVEDGPADRVLRAPEHPYTQELLRAVPRLDSGAPPVAPGGWG
jgi:peptide/nickel transport system ATP-binding protein